MKHFATRTLSLVLAFALLMGAMLPGGAAAMGLQSQQTEAIETALDFKETNGVSALNGDSQEEAGLGEEPGQTYADTDQVRVSIVLESASLLDAGFSTKGLSSNSEALSYRASLKQEQAQITAAVERILGEPLDVQWNLTVAASVISANVPFGKLKELRQLPGIKEILLETRYDPCVMQQEEVADPNMATSGEMIGSTTAWAAGYTGAGMRIAIIDTGIDTDHQSFSAEALDYALAQEADAKGMLPEEYTATLNLLDVEEIASVLEELNLTNVDAQRLYLDTKKPFAFNYVDRDYDVTHDNDTQTEHGSHVAGIAAANSFISGGDGTFSNALGAVKVQGVAPNAQIITMKVFGKSGGAYDSDYMAAIEDAIVLGCDVVNLSLGSAVAGFSFSPSYEEFLNKLVGSDTVVTISTGNAGAWTDNVTNGTNMLYSTDVSMATGGQPGTFRNALTVASVDNAGFTGLYLEAGGQLIFYAETQYTNSPISTLPENLEYIFIDGVGTVEDFAAIAHVLAGKVAVCSRGTTSFFEKAEAAVQHGAIATIIYNNQAGTINLDLSSYTQTQPCISITQADGAILREKAQPVADDEGNVLYYEGNLYNSHEVAVTTYDAPYYTMSSFSSWGVPGNLTMKPEITAPGGSIYSVDGLTEGGKAYETMSGTSMAAPQMAGLSALVIQYIEENQLCEKTGLSARTLAQSLLMSTAKPVLEEQTGYYYSIMKQGAGLADATAAISADSYILMNEDATASYADGKVKAELLDDPQRTGDYSFSFTVNNLTDEERTYSLGSSFFTQDTAEQDGRLYMAYQTTVLPVTVTYTVNGETFVPRSKIVCDLNGDGITDAEDAQMILDYTLGLEASIAPEADLDNSGDVTTRDAWLLLDGLAVPEIHVAPGEAARISVRFVMSDEQKAALEALFPNGAWVEGYVCVIPTATAEGVIAPTHTIPVLGFYGNWTDPSMFDPQSTQAATYGDTTASYFGASNSNSMRVAYPQTTGTYPHVVGNPYITEDCYPAEKMAISQDTMVAGFNISLIRNAANVAYFVQNEAGEVIYSGNYYDQVYAAYYHTGYSMWANTANSVGINQNVSVLDAREDDWLTFGIVAFPDYYTENGILTPEEIEDLIESGRLGQGAYVKKTLRIDNTAPEILDITKSAITGAMTITARDNNHIAAVQVFNAGGTLLLAQSLADQDERGETTSVVLDLSQANVGSKCLVMVADYAANETYYEVDYGGQNPDYTGKMYGFTSGGHRGTGKRWMEIDPEVLYYQQPNYGGTTNVSYTDLQVMAAEYVDGYVYIAADDGNIYISKQGEWHQHDKVCSYTKVTSDVHDMAFNYADGKLYLLGGSNDVYSLDLISGTLTPEFTLTLTNPANKTYTRMQTMAIDDQGNFYGINYSARLNSCAFLYTWTLEDVVDGRIDSLDPVNNAKTGDTNRICNYRSSLAWDHDQDMLYWSSTMIYDGSYSTSNNVLMKFGSGELETGVPVLATTYDGGTGGKYAPSALYVATCGLYIVPSAGGMVTPVDYAQTVELDHCELTLVPNAAVLNRAAVYPWSVKDKTVTWSSSDETVVTVADGLITAVGVGTATITATANAEPHPSAQCAVTVAPLDNSTISALLTGTESSSFVDFSVNTPGGWTVTATAEDYFAGTLHEGMLYLHNGETISRVDPETFAIKTLGSISSTWRWSDAATAPLTEEGYFGQLLAVCNRGQYAELLNAEEGTLIYWDLSDTFSRDPLACIAWVTDGTYNNNPAHIYYALTEKGALYRFTVYAYNYGNNYGLAMAELGTVSMAFPGASVAAGDVSASMVYDHATGYLFLTSNHEGGVAKLYAIDPQNLAVSLQGSFTGEAGMVSALYQYTRATELAVRMRPLSASIYVGDTVQLEATALPAAYDSGVTWSSADETIATVDQNGLVTGKKEGTVEVIATSVATDANGNHAQSRAVITIKPLAQVSAELSAQIVTDAGTQWVSFRTDDMSKITVDGNATTTMVAAGAHNGKIYSSDCDLSSTGHLYEIDPQKGFDEAMGYTVPAMYGVLDMTTAPGMVLNATKKNGDPVTFDVFNYPAIVCKTQNVYFVKSWTNGSMQAFTTSSYYSDLAALAYVGNTTYKYGGKNWPAQQYLALCANGDLHKFTIYARYNTTSDVVAYGLGRSAVGNIGRTFEDNTTLSMVYVNDGILNGLFVSDSSRGAELYYVDMNTLLCSKVGNVPGASFITGLYTDRELNGEPCAPLEVREGTAEVASTAYFASQELTELEMTEVDAFGGLNSTTNQEVAKPTSVGEIADGEKTVTVTVTAKNDQGVDTASNNGLVEITYDTEALTLTDITVHAEHRSMVQTEGRIKLAYADLVTLNDVATLTFAVKKTDDTTVRVKTVQLNDTKPAHTENLPISFRHPNTEIRGAVDATCTEDGYTGDICCTDCGALLEVGEAIPAKGHTTQIRNARTATCTEDGYTGDVICTVCEEILEEGEVIPAFCASAQYTDLDVTAWYHVYTCYVLKNGLMNGISDTTFAPNANLTRGQMVTVLYRAAGEPEVTGRNPFSDVPAGSYFEKAVIWAAENGITLGVSATKFAPAKDATREQMITFLYRFAKLQGADATVTGDLSAYADAATVSAWAVDAFAWAIGNGIVVGLTTDTLAPGDSATRAQVAKVIAVYREKR